ncbi:ribosomal protein S18-alanine N-acetyltransferase [Pseudanabaena minima]|uniref:ribosomal protein S18-alanine N-acetyltransferase n=1 Tax=Pseudanabaena minima TaxID=890415 RepID=UPI003DA8A2D3
MSLSTRIYLSEIDQNFLSQLREIDCACLGNFWSLEAYQREIDSPSSLVLGLTTENHELLGFGCLWSILEEAHITVLAVRPEYQGQGFGKSLVWGLLKKARDRQLEWATLEVRESNHVAIALYESFGFKEIGRRPKYYEVTGEDALMLWCKGIHTKEFELLLEQRHESISLQLLAKGWNL